MSMVRKDADYNQEEFDYIIKTGEKIGNVIDIVISSNSGNILKMIIYDNKGFFKTLRGNEEMSISWNQIKKIKRIIKNIIKQN